MGHLSPHAHDKLEGSVGIKDLLSHQHPSSDDFWSLRFQFPHREYPCTSSGCRAEMEIMDHVSGMLDP